MKKIKRKNCIMINNMLFEIKIKRWALMLCKLFVLFRIKPLACFFIVDRPLAPSQIDLSDA